MIVGIRLFRLRIVDVETLDINGLSEALDWLIHVEGGVGFSGNEL